MTRKAGSMTWLRRVVPAAGAFALGIAGMAGIAQSAQAAEPVTGVGNINPATTTSLTIHKYDGAQGDAGDGTVQDTSKMGNPLKGVEFTVTPVKMKGQTKIDLDTEAGWDAIDGITAKDVTESGSAYTQDTANATKITTNASGTATESLPHGLYLVEETGSGDNNIVSSVAPFLVTLPLSHGSGNWLYDVNVYPKNQVMAAPSKTINSDADQKGLKVGGTVQWTITQQVPRLNNGDSYDSASIWDVMPTDGSLSYDDATASVKLNGTALTKGTDYTIDPAGATWTLTSTGLGKIKAGDTITVTFTTKVEKVTKDGGIANPGSSTGTPGYGSEFNGTKVPGNPTPYTYWGQLAVKKVDESKNALKGATFKVTAKTGASCPATVPSDGVVSTGTSDGNGIVQWDATSPASSPLGLFVANSSNGPLESPSKDYCLYETQAPAGYTAAAVQTVTVKAGTENLNTVTVTDEQKGHPDLPMTGAQGIVLLSVLGVTLMVVGGVIYVTSRRRANQR